MARSKNYERKSIFLFFRQRTNILLFLTNCKCQLRSRMNCFGSFTKKCRGCEPEDQHSFRLGKGVRNKMEFECTINRKSAKEIYKKTGKNVGITIIKIIFCFLAICLFLFLLIKDIAMILLLAGSLIATVIFLIIYYQRQLNMICPKKKDGSSEYLQKWHFSKMKLRYQEI